MQETSFPPHKIIGVAVIWNDQGQILIDRRLPEGAMGGLWEFPGGKIEPGETVQECIKYVANMGSTTSAMKPMNTLPTTA
jgi:8-oxo-dGTP diphosphatase